MTTSLPVLDRRQRPLRDLRISVTDRCNFRCRYCMPREVFDKHARFLPHSEILTFEEIARLARLCTFAGVKKLRITGGEPLLRAELWKLVAQLSKLDDVDLALTTNGSLLAEQAHALRDAGLQRVTVSLDTLNDEVFRRMTDSRVAVSQVLNAIEAADRAGLRVKVNSVVQRGVNDRHVVELADYFKRTGHTVRFIEYMDVGASNHWRSKDVTSGADIVEAINAVHPLRKLPARYMGEVAQRWAYVDGSAEIGVITSVSEPFCNSCTRARLSAEGKLYTCLFATEGTDFRTALRDGSSDDAVLTKLRGMWSARADNYSEQRASRPLSLRKIEMSYIGG